MGIFEIGDVLFDNTDESIVINEVLQDEINKVIYLASKNENYGLLVLYANIDLSEQLRIAKVISALSTNNSKYKLCKYNTEGIGFFIKGCNKIVEANFSVEFQNREELCIKLVTEFMMIHKEGLSFAEVGLTSFAYNKDTNEIGIITPEKIGDYGEKIENVSGWLTGCMAPEVVSNVQLPDIYSDRYSLAVMLFKVMFGTDPMIGKRIKSEMEAFPGRVYVRWWNEDSLFIFDKDQSNACSDDDVIEKWKATDAKIRVEFEKNFSRVTKREERTSERCWITLFKQNENVVKEDLKLKSQVYHLVFVVANPISMEGAKIGTVTSALEELISELRLISEANYGIDIHLSIMTVSNNAKWIFLNTQINREIDSKLLMTSESNEINVASAMELLRKDFIIPNRSCSQMVCPTIIWFVDNHVIGNYKYQLEINNLFALYRNTMVYGVSIGEAADDEFLNCVCSEVVKVHTPESLMKFIKFINFDDLTDDMIKTIDCTFPDKKTVYVMRELGETGRAKEYYCLYDNMEAIYREFYNPIIPMAELYDETKIKIKSGELPGEWPIALSKSYEDKFGYVYKKLSNKCETTAFESIKARILACRNIVKLYGIIHDRGFCFQHPHGKANFNIDYQTGKVELICVDEILTLGKYYGIGRSSLETAPELFWNDEPSNIEGDRYSLSVLLFEILFDGHPFSGKKTIGHLTSETQRLWFVDSPIYVWDYRNDSNRPLDFQNNGLKAPQYIMNAFSYAFSDDVIRLENHKKRIKEREWYSLFKQWWDEIKQCS